MRGFLLAIGLLVLPCLPAHTAPLPAALAPPPDATLPSPGPDPGSANLLTRHREIGLSCLSCHRENPPAASVATDECKSCHGSDDDIADLTDDNGASNPHASHNGPLPCEKCHHVHRASENFCATCHADQTGDVP